VLAHVARDGQQIRRLRLPRQLDQHREIDAGDDFDSIAFDERHREVRRRAAEHVGEQQDARFAADALDGLRDIFPGVGYVVVPADRHGREPRQISHNHLGGIEQLGGQLPVGHDDDANHGSILRQVMRV